MKIFVMIAQICSVEPWVPLKRYHMFYAVIPGHRALDTCLSFITFSSAPIRLTMNIMSP